MAGVEKAKEKASGMKGALAIFAKTSGLSSVKTRLAADIGRSLAEAFYTLSVEAVTEIAKAAQKQSSNNLLPYWALAEENAVNLECWNKLSTLWTGEGDLGMRLHTIYSTLRKKHDYVMLIGTDSPQLEPELLMDAIKKLSEQPKSCVIGPATDGGFYLFAAGIPIPKNVWTNVTYSQNNTLKELTDQLAKHKIPVYLLSMQGDIDVAADIKPLMKALEANHNILPAQQKLYRWLKNQGY